MIELIHCFIILVTALVIYIFSDKIAIYTKWFYGLFGINVSDFTGNGGYLKFFSGCLLILSFILFILCILHYFSLWGQ